MSTSIDIFVNGEQRSVATGCNVLQLLDELGLAAGRLAVERNREILPREQYDTPLAAGDRLEIVSFVGGG